MKLPKIQSLINIGIGQSEGCSHYKLFFLQILGVTVFRISMFNLP